MATIHFKAKPETIYNVDLTPAYTRIKVPVLTPSHCDMGAFRKHPKFGAYANSDLFPNLLARVRKERLGDYIRLDRPLPAGVTVTPGAFLSVVSIDV